MLPAIPDNAAVFYFREQEASATWAIATFQLANVLASEWTEEKVQIKREMQNECKNGNLGEMDSTADPGVGSDLRIGRQKRFGATAQARIARKRAVALKRSVTYRPEP